jgi:uncharacterized membrane protein
VKKRAPFALLGDLDEPLQFANGLMSLLVSTEIQLVRSGSMTNVVSGGTLHDNDHHDPARPGVELRWPASAIWRPGEPAIRRIGTADLVDAVRKGFEDFKAVPSHLVFLAVIYPVLGLILGRLFLGYDVLALVYPVLAGLTLIGPVIVIGQYEISRRRELGLPTSLLNGLDVFANPSKGAIARLSLLVFGLFFEWLALALLMYRQLLGATPPDSVQAFVHQVLTTPNGQQMMLAGNLLGFVFAVIVLMTSVVSFPMLVDRNVGAAVAVRTSIRAVLENPVTMALWGLCVAAALLVGCLTLFIGLALVLPILGHATWHLYRKVVER